MPSTDNLYLACRSCLENPEVGMDQSVIEIAKQWSLGKAPLRWLARVGVQELDSFFDRHQEHDTILEQFMVITESLMQPVAHVMPAAGKKSMATTMQDDPRGWARQVCTYHAPDEEARRRHEAINTATEDFLVAILENTPRCADQTAAIRLARDAKATANAAIALNGLV